MPEAGQGSQKLFANHLLITAVLGLAAVGLWVAAFDHDASVGNVLLALAGTATVAAANVGVGCIRQRSAVNALTRTLAEQDAELVELTMTVSSLVQQQKLALAKVDQIWTHVVGGAPVGAGAQIYDLGRRTADNGGPN